MTDVWCMSVVREYEAPRGRHGLGPVVGGDGLAWSVLEGLPGAAVVVFDRELRVVACAGAALASRGFDRELMLGRELSELLPTAAFARYAPHYQTTLKGEASSLEAETSDGEQIFATEFSPLRGSDRSVVGGIAVSRDVTGARHAEQALVASERQFRELAEEATDLQARIAPDGVFLFVSQASRRLLGYAPEELVRKSIHALMHEDDLARVEQRRAVLERSDGVVRQEARLRHRDGSWRWCESTVRLVREAGSGRVLESHCSIRDITERRENEERRWQWEQMFNSTTRGICVSDAETMLIESVNPAFAHMHGGAIEDFVGQPITVLLPAEQRVQLPGMLSRIDREDFVRVDSEHVRRDGSVFPVRAEMLATRDASGKLLYRIAWCDDLTEQHAAEAARREATELFETAFAGAPSGVALIGLDGRFLRVNAALCQMLGRPEVALIGSTSEPFTHPDDQQITADAYKHLLTVGTPLSVEKRYLRPDGQIVWAATVGATVERADRQPSLIVSHFNDITVVKEAQLRQTEATARFETAFADAPIGMALLALDGRWLKVNRTLCELSGYTEDQLLKLTFQQLTHPEDLDADLEQVEQLLAGKIDRYTMEKRYFTATGEEIWTKLAVSLVRDASGEPLHFISQIEDISERKRLETELQRLADHDPLTELWNRRRFEHELHRQIERCKRYREHAALLVLDLDGFKQINDDHGHKTGDELLKRIAHALQGRLRASDGLARIGGDEFAIILTNITPSDANQLATALSELIASATITPAGGEIGVTASIGIYNLDQRTDNGDHAFVQADAAMYHAKSQHPGRTT